VMMIGGFTGGHEMTTTISPTTAFAYKAVLFVFWPIPAAILLLTFAAILVVAWPAIWFASIERNKFGSLEIKLK